MQEFTSQELDNLLSTQNIENTIDFSGLDISWEYNINSIEAILTEIEEAEAIDELVEMHVDEVDTILNNFDEQIGTGNNTNVASPGITLSQLDRLIENINESYAEENGDEEEQQGGINYFTFINELHSTNERFRLRESIYNISIPNIVGTTFVEAMRRVEDMFTQLHSNFVAPIQNNQKIRLIFNHTLFDYAINMPMVNKDVMTIDRIRYLFSEQIQSYKDMPEHEIRANHVLTVNVVVADSITGGSNTEFTQQCIDKSSIKVIRNTDNFCLVRAIIVGKAYADKDHNARKLLRPNNRILNEKTLKIVEQLQLPNRQCGIEQVKKIEALLRDYQIMIIDEEGVAKDPLYLNKNHNFKKFIYISFNQNHFNVITSMRSFTRSNYYCDVCKKGYHILANHTCSNTCIACKRTNCDKSSHKMKCFQCKRLYNNADCLKLHNAHFCPAKLICTDCGRKKNYNHVCEDNFRWCSICKSSVPINDHKCFIQQENIEKELKNVCKGFIFFDYECTVVQNKHIPNLIMARKIYLDKNDLEKYTQDPQMFTFNNNNDFCKWLLEHEHFIAIAHNMKGYDGSFIMQYFLNNLKSDDSLPECLITGTKTLSMKHRKLKIIDSYSFLPMALEKFSATFNLTELKKGFFPHKFNVEKNFDYIGRYPEKSYYGSEFFSAKKKDEFDIWYETIKNGEFNFQHELHSYCWSDVELLTQGCLQFRQHIISQTKKDEHDRGVDPFQTSITIASMCNYIFRRNFMQFESIGIIPENGYNCKIKTSIKCRQWLKYLMHRDNIHINHACNGGEVTRGKYFLDGYDTTNNTIYEFHGCFWHGCLVCHYPHTWNSVKQQTMYTLNEATKKRINEIRNMSPNTTIVEIWECDFDEQLKNNQNLRDFVEQNQIKPRLLPRDALYGGRTEAIKLYHYCEGKLFFFFVFYCNKLIIN